MEAHQAPLSLRFSRQEHWSGLPFPSPMHESEKWKWSRSVLSDSYRLHGLQPTRLLRPWDFPGKNTGVGCQFPLQGILLSQGWNLCLLIGRQILYHWATREAHWLKEPKPIVCVFPSGWKHGFNRKFLLPLESFSILSVSFQWKGKLCQNRVH